MNRQQVLDYLKYRHSVKASNIGGRDIDMVDKYCSFKSTPKSGELIKQAIIVSNGVGGSLLLDGLINSLIKDFNITVLTTQSRNMMFNTIQGDLVIDYK